MELKHYNINLVDLTDILLNDIIVDWLDYNEKLQLHKGPKNKEIYTLYHFFIKSACTLILSSKSNAKTILFISLDLMSLHNKTVLSKTRLTATQLLRVINKMIVDIERHFPIRIISSALSYDSFTSIIAKGDGNGDYLLSLLRIKINKLSSAKFPYQTAKKFCDRYGLDWLNEHFFCDFKVKALSFI